MISWVTLGMYVSNFYVFVLYLKFINIFNSLQKHLDSVTAYLYYYSTFFSALECV